MGNGSTDWARPQEGGATLVRTAAGEAISVPSGQPVSLQDVVWNEPGPFGLTLRFRFVAPEIAPGGRIDSGTATADMAALCQSYALPRIDPNGPQPAQVIISMSDRPVPFGEALPEVTQYFEAFRIENGACIWEMF